MILRWRWSALVIVGCLAWGVVSIVTGAHSGAVGPVVGFTAGIIAGAVDVNREMSR